MIEPRLRFKADDGSDFPDWEEKKIASLGDMVGGGTPTTKKKEYWHGKTAWISSADVEENDIYNINMTRFITQEAIDNSATKIIPKNSILIVSRVGVGKVAKAPCDLCTSQDFTNIVDVKGDSTFLTYAVLRLMQSKLQCVQGTSIKGIPSDEIRNYIMNVPSLPEQQKIADFLSTIDTIIEKQRAMVLAWEERKKGVMQKLFSQEVRFKADDGSDFPDWEEKSFVNTFDSLNNSTFSRDCLNYENGSVKYIHYGDILVKYNSSVDVCDAIVPFVNEDLDCERFAILQDGDIVIADTAEDDTVGKVIEIENTSNVKTIAGLHTIACRPKEKFASKYLGYYMNSDEYHNQLRPYMQGIKVTSISKSNIALTKIMVPSLPEQQKIADCLSALDTVIQKQKETLEKWQELKKGLLQQMFV